MSRGVLSRLSSMTTRLPSRSMASRSMRPPWSVFTWRPMTIQLGAATEMSVSRMPSSCDSRPSVPQSTSLRSPSMRQNPNSSGITLNLRPAARAACLPEQRLRPMLLDVLHGVARVELSRRVTKADVDPGFVPLAHVHRGS